MGDPRFLPRSCSLGGPVQTRGQRFEVYRFSFGPSATTRFPPGDCWPAGPRVLAVSFSAPDFLAPQVSCRLALTFRQFQSVLPATNSSYRVVRRGPEALSAGRWFETFFSRPVIFTSTVVLSFLVFPPSRRERARFSFRGPSIFNFCLRVQNCVVSLLVGFGVLLRWCHSPRPLRFGRNCSCCYPVLPSGCLAWS